MTPEQRRHLIYAPLRIWLGLCILLGLTATYAYLPHAPIKPIVSLLIAAAKGTLIVLFFMQLRKAEAIVRLAALVGVIWASFLFLFSFADFLTR